MKTNVEKQCNRPLLLRNRSLKSDGKNSSKGMSLRGRSPSGKRPQRPCEDYISGKCTNPLCDSWHHLLCQNTKHNRDADSVKKCAFLHTEVDSQPNNQPQKNGGKGSVAILKNSTECCVFQDAEPPKSNSILRKDTKSLGPKHSVQCSKGTSRPVKIRERKNPSQGVIQRSDPQERSL